MGLEIHRFPVFIQGLCLEGVFMSHCTSFPSFRARNLWMTVSKGLQCRSFKLRSHIPAKSRNAKPAKVAPGPYGSFRFAVLGCTDTPMIPIFLKFARTALTCTDCSANPHDRC